MKIAIVGAGFSGLAVCFHLSQACKVTLFDSKGIGKGASGVSSGLLHPYPAADGKRSYKADLALKEAKELLQSLQNFSDSPLFHDKGIMRHAWTEEQCARFKTHIHNYQDVEQCGENLFLIRSALTIYVPRYLEALWAACESFGASLEIKTLSSVDELKEYDKVILAAGWGMKDFKECSHLRINYVKGQKLVCQTADNDTLPQSVMSKKYLARMEISNQFEIGSTYERGFTDDLPCLETALKELHPALEEFSKEAQVMECKAGVRVTRKEGYLPIAEKLSDRCFALTAMGSRGLLYHAYYGKMVAQTILAGRHHE